MIKTTTVFCAAIMIIFFFLSSMLYAQEADPEEEAPAQADADGTVSDAEDVIPEEQEEISAEGKKHTAPNLIEKIRQGGSVVLILIFIWVALIAITIERLFNLRSKKAIPDGLLERVRSLWREKNYDGIVQLCRERPSSISAIIAAFARHRTCSSMEINTLGGDIASQDLKMKMQKLVPFALIATISPLLGLLGTVRGMIEAFDVVAVAGSLGDASLLADGISKALITTAAGLIVAVPAIALYNYFKIKTSKISLLLETEVNMLISDWFLSDHNKEENA